MFTLSKRFQKVKWNGPKTTDINLKDECPGGRDNMCRKKKMN